MLTRFFKVSIVLVIVFNTLTGCIKAEKNILAGNEPVFVYGNTSGNHSNYGLAAMQEDWVFFSTISNFSYLYKISATGIEKTLLSEGDCNYINVVGDSIYFIGGTNRLTKIQTDGSSKTELLRDISFGNIYIVDDWIYYTDYSELDGLYRIRTDGKGKKKITGDRAQDFFDSGNRIYYCNMYLSGGLFSVSTDGKDKMRIVDAQISAINLVDEWLYYINSSDGNSIWKVQIDGQNRMKLVNDAVSSINAAGDWIYYSNANDKNSLYRIRTDGTDNKLLNAEYTAKFCVAGDWIYYTTSGSQLTYRIRTDGTDRHLV